MADMTPNRFGLINNTGTADAMFLKVFGGEVLTAFDEANVTISRQMVRTIPNGKSASFPATWKAGTSYHTPGAQLLGDAILNAERIITIDDLLISKVGIAQIDEAKSHYDVRSIYSTQIGRSLAKTLDQHCLQVGVLAARATTTVTGGNGGTRIIGSNIDTAIADLEAACFSAAQAMDEKDVPENDRYLALKPAQYYLLVSGSTKVLNRDYNPNPNGGYAIGKVREIAGFEIVKTNHLPHSNITTGPTAYRGNFSSNIGLAWQKGAFGTVKLIDLAIESEWLIEYQTTLMLGKLALGHGILRPECAVELAETATS